nr:type II toxin-antitoxin system HicA family toxin [Halomarina sp. PSRA2]
MVSRDFSGKDVITVLCNTGNFWVGRITGDHYILKWEHPDGPDVEQRTVVVPYHDRLRTGTLRSIAEQAGANDFGHLLRSKGRSLSVDSRSGRPYWVAGE